MFITGDKIMIISYEKKINRKVRVFISSTFSDMKKERDIIVHSVFPRLRREFTPKMIDINEVDLRWGIPEEDSETSKILEICIGEVLHCLPFFVGIVGQNYGSIASREAIENLPPAYRKAVGGDLPDNTSITELEMRAGVFIPKNADFSSFFLKKNIDKKEILPQLERLITNINSGYNTYTYDNLKMFEEFASLKDKYEEETDANQFNLETLDLFLKYHITDVNSVETLIEHDKLKLDGVEAVLAKYKKEEK